MSEQSIFIEALEKDDPARRAAFLNQACAGNADLRQRVERLLTRHQGAGSFLEYPAHGLELTTDPPIAERPGSQIGPYKLLEQIGEGGFGVVFMAEQTQPIQRKVALKIIKPGMDTRQVIARFEAERQALALMDHPNIARVLDAGATETGRPFFVMELVRGVPITEYCDQHRVPIRQRLELFATTCQAVQHAHQKGIIHRDLKPTNVLVTLHDGRPVVKVIDFGVAKATGQKLTDKTLFTGFAQLVGTPLYMSPEQAEMSGLDVDTRSDIYSLGVLLYELLTGSTPFDKERLKSASFDEFRRIIREEDPQRPSTRLSTLAQQAISTVSQQRSIEPRYLSRLFQGELDWIVMKALEKDRNRRYETAGALADDVEHYLANEPVQACPPSALYRLRKFAGRNKAALVTSSLVAAALIAGTVISTWQAIRAVKAEATAKANEQQALSSADAERKAKEAEAQQRAVADASAKRAEENAKRADAVSKFLVEAFRSPDPDKDGRKVTIAEVLDRSAKDLKDKFADDPRTKAELLFAIGKSYVGLGLYREAIPPLEQSLQLRKATLAPDHPETLNSMNSLANAYDSAGRSDEALQLHEETLKLRKAKLGLDHPDTLNSMNNLATAYHATGRFNDSLQLLEETLKLRKAKLGLHHPDTLTSMNNLANAYEDAGRLNEALQLHEETLKLQKAELGPDHPTTLMFMSNLASAYGANGRLGEGLQLQQETLDLEKAKLGPDHPETLRTMNNLSVMYRDAGRFDEAIRNQEEALALQKAKLGPDHPNTLSFMGNLANSYWAAGRFNEALQLREETLELQKAKLGPGHPRTLASMNMLAVGGYLQAERTEEAARLLEEALELARTNRGPTDGLTLLSSGNLVKAYLKAGRTDDVLRVTKETLTLLGSKPIANDNRQVINNIDGFVSLCEGIGRSDELLPFLEVLLPDAAVTWRVRGDVHAKQGLPDQAAEDFVKAIELSTDKGYAFDGARVLVCRQLSRWEQVFDRVVELRPDIAALWIGHAQRRALQSRWADALADFARGIEGRSISNDTDEYAWLLVLMNDAAGYRKFWQGLVASAAQPLDPTVAFHLARAGAALPLDDVDAAQLVQWAKLAVTKDSHPNGTPFVVHTVGLAQYRSGQFEAAIETAEKSNAADWGTGRTSPKQGPKAQNWLVMAMAHHRLGHAAKANECLTTARQIVKEFRPKNPDDPVDMHQADWIEIHVLLREADALIKGGQLPQRSEREQTTTDNRPLTTDN